MREVLFRGKLRHSGEWIIGNLIIAQNGQPYIIPNNVFEPDGHHLIIDSDNPFWVFPETVGQFTGLTDKNGVKIFEWDVIKWKYDFYWEAVVSTVPNSKSNTLYAIETFTDCFYDMDEDVYKHIRGNHLKGKRNDIEYLFYRTVVVLGNIHDNPELLTK